MTTHRPEKPTATAAEGEEFRLHLCVGWHRCIDGTWAYLGEGDPYGFVLTYDMDPGEDLT